MGLTASTYVYLRQCYCEITFSQLYLEICLLNRALQMTVKRTERISFLTSFEQFNVDDLALKTKIPEHQSSKSTRLTSICNKRRASCFWVRRNLAPPNSPSRAKNFLSCSISFACCLLSERDCDRTHIRKKSPQIPSAKTSNLNTNRVVIIENWNKPCSFRAA